MISEFEFRSLIRISKAKISNKVIKIPLRDNLQIT